jgi:hypothetical protein
MAITKRTIVTEQSAGGVVTAGPIGTLDYRGAGCPHAPPPSRRPLLWPGVLYTCARNLFSH